MKQKKGRSIVILETPLDYIIIMLLDNKTQKYRHKDTIPEDFNLLQDDSSNKVMILIGNISWKHIKIGRTNINYKDHPLELGFAFTVWKVQGISLDKIILALEPLGRRRAWTFENFYVRFSRVRTINGIRCLPLSNKFDRIKFLTK